MNDDDDITRNYHGGHPRSLEANPDAETKNRHRRIIHEFLYQRGAFGATCDEAIVALNIEHMTCSARFSDMKRDGVIVSDKSDRDNGITRTRPIGWRLTRKGNKADVHVLLQFAPPILPKQTELPLTRAWFEQAKKDLS
jgi:hypothetical protein